MVYPITKTNLENLTLPKLGEFRNKYDKGSKLCRVKLKLIHNSLLNLIPFGMMGIRAFI